MKNKLNNMILLEGGSSNKKIYRFNNNKLSYIVLDFSNDIDEFYNHLNVYNILKNMNISIPEIFEVYNEDHIIVTEDYGDERFDKNINKNDLYNLLKCAVDSLIIIKNSYIDNNQNTLINYNYNIFKTEISEFVDYFFPYKKINSQFTKRFFEIWENYYKNFKFNFNSFVHKDFELTNLIYLKNRKNNMKCGIIDFQSAFKGFSGWDLFSLLENSRIYFSRDYNENFIKHFYKNTNQILDFDSFREQYYFFNTARQTRLLGRWIKFSNIQKKNNYLIYLKPTLKRLEDSLNNLNDESLKSFYEIILK